MKHTTKSACKLGPVFTSPCCIGDNVYLVDSHGVIHKETVFGVLFWKDGTFVLRAGLYSVLSSHIGVNAFFSQEQAEKAAATKKGLHNE